MRGRLLTLCVLGLAMLVPAAGCGDDAAPRAVASGTAARKGPGDGPLVPLAGARPAHVVGASSFNRFHLLTTGEGFPRKAAEDDAAGVDSG